MLEDHGLTFWKLEASGVSNNGKPWSFALYAEGHVSPEPLRWEIRRILPALGYDVVSEHTEVWRRMKALKACWQEAFQDMKLVWDQECGLSENALRLRKQTSIEDSSKHHWLSTRAVLAVMTKMVSFRKEVEDRRLCQDVFKAYLERTLTVDDVVSLRLQEFQYQKYCNLCRRTPLDDDGSCFCMSSSWRKFWSALSSYDGSPQSEVSIAFQQLASRKDCPAVRSCLLELVSAVAEKIDQNREEWGSYNPLKDETVHMMGLSGSKRRRFHQGWTHAVALKAISEGRSTSAGLALQVLEGTDHNFYSTLMEQRVLDEFRASFKLTFEAPPRNIGLCWDGIRAGNPAKEVIACFAWHCRKKMVAAVQPLAYSHSLSHCHPG